MKEIRLKNWEYQLVLVIAKVLVVIIALVGLVFKVIYKFKRYIYKIALVILITYSSLNALQTIAYAPKANASQYQYSNKPQMEHELIVNEIYNVFGKDAPKAFKLLNCENKRLNPNAINDNTVWGGVGRDYSIFQINDTWQRVQPKFLLNWRVNILVAKQIYDESHSFKMWTCGKELGI